MGDDSKPQVECSEGDRLLFNDFWLNEIKSQEDSIRLLMNINILLTGAYITITAANSEDITKYLDIKWQDDPVFAFILFIIPIFFWILSIYILIQAQYKAPNDARQLFISRKLFINHEETIFKISESYLVRVFEYKYYSFRRAYTFFMVPFVYSALLLFKPLRYIIISLLIQFKPWPSIMLSIISLLILYCIHRRQMTEYNKITKDLE